MAEIGQNVADFLHDDDNNDNVNSIAIHVPGVFSKKSPANKKLGI